MNAILESNVRHKFTSEYKRLRKLGWSAQGAYDAAKVHAEWFRVHDGDNVQTLGNVRVLMLPDDYFDMDDLKGDMFVPRHNPSISKARLRRQELEFEQRVEHENVWTMQGEYFDGEEWVYVDSCGGFIGDDAVDSGYDIDIMRATLDAAETCRNSALLVGSV